MEEAQAPENAELAPELASVAEAAGGRLRTEVDGDQDAEDSGTQALLAAATSAMNAGYSLSEIAQAEARGKADVRTALRPDTLKRVERTGRNVRAAQAEHHHTIARAVRLGLSTRQIAAAAGVTHGTVRAIANRLSAEGSTGDPSVEAAEWSEQESQEGHEPEPDGWSEQPPHEHDGEMGDGEPPHQGEDGW